jgi:hypothetical protein
MGLKLGLLILRKKHRLRVFKNRGLRRSFEIMRGEVKGGWRKLPNCVICTLRQV